MVPKWGDKYRSAGCMSIEIRALAQVTALEEGSRDEGIYVLGLISLALTWCGSKRYYTQGRIYPTASPTYIHGSLLTCVCIYIAVRRQREREPGP